MAERTLPLSEFFPKYVRDDNEWWRLGTGDMQNLFDEAVEERDLWRAAYLSLWDLAYGENGCTVRWIGKGPDAGQVECHGYALVSEDATAESLAFRMRIIAWAIAARERGNDDFPAPA